MNHRLQDLVGSSLSYLSFDTYDCRHGGVEDAYSIVIDSERISRFAVFGMASAKVKVSESTPGTTVLTRIFGEPDPTVIAK